MVSPLATSTPRMGSPRRQVINAAEVAKTPVGARSRPLISLSIATENCTLRGRMSPAEPLRFLDCDSGVALSGPLRLPPTTGQQVVGNICHGLAGTSPTSFGIGEFPPERQWDSGRRADATHFSAREPSTITVGGVELYRRPSASTLQAGPAAAGRTATTSGPSRRRSAATAKPTSTKCTSATAARRMPRASLPRGVRSR